MEAKILAAETAVVLTGDVVGSSRLSVDYRRSIRDVLSEASSTLRRRYRAAIPYDIDLFRGDSWQLLIIEPEVSLLAALYTRAVLRAAFDSSRVDTRVVLGAGSIDFLPEGGRVSTGDGSAFRRSGITLEELSRSHRMAFCGNGGRTSRCLDTVLKVVDFPATWWTQKQAHAVAQSLLGKTQEEIADDWPEHRITQQAVAQHLARAGWHSVDTAVSFFAEAIRMVPADKL